MTQPYIYDETSTFHFDESQSFQYPDNFQSFSAGYHDYQPIGSAWPSSNEHINSTMPLFYEEISFPTQQAYLQPATSQAPLPQQDLSPVSIDSYAPMYGYPIALETPQTLPYDPKTPIHQRQIGGYSPVSETDTIPSLPPKRPVIALQWRDGDSNAPVKERPKPAKKLKTISIAPAIEPKAKSVKATTPSSPQQASSRSLEDCMGLFDTTLTATKEKRRRKVFSAQEKKVVKSVRTVGACIQCKFRKKTVSLNCSYDDCGTNITCPIV
jgi:hypothetical protein